MKYRKLFSRIPMMMLALLLLSGCGATATTPTSTPAQPTPTPIPTLTTPQPTPTPQAQTATLPVKLAQPLVIQDNQVKFTVTAVGPVVGDGAYIQPMHQNTYHLLQITITAENLAGTQVWFGLDPNLFEEQGQAQTNYKLLSQSLGVSSVETLSLKDDKGVDLKVGGDKGPTGGNWGYATFSIQPSSSIQVEIAVIVPNQATQFTASVAVATIQ